MINIVNLREKYIFEGDFDLYLTGKGKKFKTSDGIKDNLLEEGEFVNGLLNGEGVIYDDDNLDFSINNDNIFGVKNEKKYKEGFFKDGKLNGKGKIYNLSYVLIEGNFIEGQYDGIVTTYFEESEK